MRYALACTFVLSLFLVAGCSNDQKTATTPAQEDSTLTDILTLKPVWDLFSGPDEITAAEMRAEMANDLHTPAQTRTEYENRTSLTTIINGRKFNQDVMRTLLLDRPSRGMDYPTSLE